MKKGSDIAVEFPGLYLVHHNIPGKEVGLHQHDEHLLFLPLQGEIRVELEGRSITCGPGRMVYLPPRTAHAFQSSARQGERLIALLKPQVWGKKHHAVSVLVCQQLLKELLFYLLLNPKTSHAKAFVEALGEILRTLLEDTPSTEAALETLTNRTQDERIQKALGVMTQNLSEPLSMVHLAREAGLSQRSLNRHFLQEVGLTPKKYLVQLRVARAKELLRSKKYSVTETALEVGYSSLSQFISVFRQVTGVLPSDF